MKAVMWQLDCWGNERDGYEVNNQFRLAEKDWPGDQDFTRADALAWIEERFGDLSKDAFVDDYWDDDEWDLRFRGSGRPIIAIRIEED